MAAGQAEAQEVDGWVVVGQSSGRGGEDSMATSPASACGHEAAEEAVAKGEAGHQGGAAVHPSQAQADAAGQEEVGPCSVPHGAEARRQAS